MMRKVLFVIAAISGLISVGSLVAPHVSIDGLSVTPATPASVIPVPDGATQLAVEPLTRVLTGKAKEAAILAEYFSDMATVAKSFPDKFDSVGELERHINVSTTALDILKPIDVAGFNEAAGKATENLFGADQSKKLTNAPASLLALAWACKEAK